MPVRLYDNHAREFTDLTNPVGEELDTARVAHKDEIILLQDLHRGVVEIKERLRLDAERVKLEQQKLIEAEEAVRHQEERLRFTFEQLELHEGRYQAKGGRGLFHTSFVCTDDVQ
jgi:hypothetical protein